MSANDPKRTFHLTTYSIFQATFFAAGIVQVPFQERGETARAVVKVIGT
jgi:hypothetical protein